MKTNLTRKPSRFSKPRRFKPALRWFTFIAIISISTLPSSCTKAPTDPTLFSSNWSNSKVDRPWAGAEYWLNPLQAWKQKEGKLHCEVSGGDRNVVLLTRSINDAQSAFETSVFIDTLKKGTSETIEESSDQAATDGNLPKGLSEEGWVGFQIGLKGRFNDYRDDVIKGKGLSAGLSTEGKLFIGDLSHFEKVEGDIDKMTLKLSATPLEGGDFQLELTCLDNENQELQKIERKVHASWLPGLMALTCSQSAPDSLDWTAKRPRYVDIKELNKRVGGSTNFAFSHWKVGGDKIDIHEERAYGPILWAQHTISNDVMKMSVQFVPVGNDNREAVLFIDGLEAQKATIDQDGNNVLYKVEDWGSEEDHSYKIVYTTNEGIEHIFEGTIRKDPLLKEDVKHASLSCVDDRGFPHQDLVDNVAAHQPDILSFHGDQLYERVAGYGVERNSKLDYLRKWYIFGWSFRDLMRNTPTVIIPDDHDVFHGNLWGCGGKAANVNLGYGYDSQDSGGYKEPADFVNMVHRTQTGHLPDAFDPTPVEQDISVYYTNMNYGGVSFAILGDRQWKSAPKPLLPDAEIENGWPQNTSWNPKTEAFHEDAELLGPRQEAFLEEWVSDWGEGVQFKAVISQSPFCNVATLPADIWHDKYVPGLPRYKKGEYPPDDRPVADFDSNSWPQNKRNKAIKTIRKAFALHITGDQHLGSTGQYGTDEYGDAGFWISTPAVANLWPRRWFPAKEGDGGKDEGDTRRYTGNYEDGFGNKITVKAIANPYDIDREPAMVFDKAPGYSIITYRKSDRTMDLAVWPRWASVNQAAPDNAPFEGWPVKVSQVENYGRKVAGALAPIEVDGEEVIQVFNETTNELIYTLRPPKGSFEAKVFDADATYLLKQIKKNGETTETKNLKIK